jgi:hypothetical protein
MVLVSKRVYINECVSINECVKERKELDQRTGMAAQMNGEVVGVFIPICSVEDFIVGKSKG